MRGVLLALVAVASGCRDDTCLRGTCAQPCAQLTFTCDAKPMYVGRVADAPAPYRLVLGNGGAEDILLSNGRVTAVISAIDTPNDLAPTGGNIVDFGPSGGVDDLTVVYQTAGLLPDDAFAYRTAAFAQHEDMVSLTVRGTLDGRPDVAIVTHYELHACDPGLRVRSELFNGSADTEAFFVADVSHWGKKRVVPFAPAPHQGYVQPELKLLELTAQWTAYDFVAGAAPTEVGPAYGAIACGRTQLSGVNDLEISALGTPMTYVAPGDTLVHERLLVTTGEGNGPAPAVEQLALARAQMFGETTATVRGRVVAGGLPFGGDVRRASIVVLAGDRPLSAVVPAADGTFAATVPGGAPLRVEVWSFGRKVADATGDGDLGDLTVPEPAIVQLAVTRTNGTVEEPAWAVVTFAPADEATRAAVTGTFHGRMAVCAPWLGPPNGRSPACDKVIVEPQGTELEVPAGHYTIYATAGPEHTLATATVELVAGEIEPIALHLIKLQVAPAGWLSADLHVHGRASFDSGLPDEDRVKSFVAQGVDVIAATDHDVIGDYTETVGALGLSDRIVVMGGLETTQLIPWMDVVGEDIPRVIGHFNFWPLVRVPSAPRAGAPWDELMEPGELFDRMAPLVGDGGMMMLNHPWDEPYFGRDLGYLRAVKFDPRRPITERDTTNSVLLRRPAGGHRNVDWNVLEIINGADMAELQKSRVLWASLLAQGFITPGAGNSDSHTLTEAQLGWARNWVNARTDLANFDAGVFNAAIREGKMIAGNGVVVTVAIGPPGSAGRGLGLAPYHPAAGDELHIIVSAAPWIPVDEVRIVTSEGTRVIASGAELFHPSDPFSAAGIVRYDARLKVSDLVFVDDFLIVEAGLPYPLAADLDNDGVPDTTDNNGDGRVDAADIEPDEDQGPIAAPPDPTNPADPRFLVTRVVAGAWPEGFANPLLIDVDGNGWTPPGLPRMH